MVHARDVNDSLFYRQIDRVLSVVELKGFELSLKTAARPSYFKGCAQEITNNAFLIVNRNVDKQNITEHRAGL